MSGAAALALTDAAGLRVGTLSLERIRAAIQALGGERPASDGA